MIYGYDYVKRYTGGNGSYDANGDWVESRGSWSSSIPCDAQHPSSGYATIIRDEAGAVADYSYSIFLDAAVADFAIGDKVKLSVGGGTEKEYIVKGSRRFRTVYKIWV